MDMERNLPDVLGRRQMIVDGDAQQIAKQHAAGKRTARERVALLMDEGSFVETDALAANFGRSGVVTGYGLIDGRPVYVYAQDFTVKGGSVGVEHSRKVLKVLSLAEKTGSPVIAILDSAGARLDEGMAAVDAYAQLMARTAELSGVVPQIALVLGPCAGGAAMCAQLSDAVLIGKAGRLFLNGPQLAASVSGVDMDLEKLAGSQASAASGAAHLACGTDEETIEAARTLISMLPGNNLEDAPYGFDSDDDADRAIPELDAGAVDVRAMIAALADDGAVCELSQAHAPEMVTALLRIGGTAVGVVATDPKADEGRLTVAGSRKAARFVRFLDCFSIPAVTLVDTAGSAIAGLSQGDAIRAGAQLMYAYAESTAPRIAVITGGAIGTGAAAMASRPAADMIYAWPGSVISPMGAPAAVQLLYKKELHEAADPAAKRAELENKYRLEVADGLNAAVAGLVDDVIAPSTTRKAIAQALSMLAGKRVQRPAKKHGNLPL